jgi:hypothetical protein
MSVRDSVVEWKVPERFKPALRVAVVLWLFASPHADTRRERVGRGLPAGRGSRLGSSGLVDDADELEGGNRSGEAFHLQLGHPVRLDPPFESCVGTLAQEDLTG